MSRKHGNETHSRYGVQSRIQDFEWGGAKFFSAPPQIGKEVGRQGFRCGATFHYYFNQYR